MASNIGLIADAVKTKLSAGTFTVTIAPTVRYDVEEELADLSTLFVDVMPAKAPFEMVSRSDGRYEVGIDVAVRKRFGTTDQNSDGTIKNASVTALMELLEDMNEYLAASANRRLSSVNALWIKSDIRWPWIPEHLRKFRQYTGVFSATYAFNVTIS